jgi:hypothetical protein
MVCEKSASAKYFCNVMTYARKMNPLYTVYKINGSMLEKPESIRDLGVTFNSKLSFNDHVDLVAQSAFKSLGFIMRNSREISDADTLKTLYLCDVRSIAS